MSLNRSSSPLGLLEMLNACVDEVYNSNSANCVSSHNLNMQHIPQMPPLRPPSFSPFPPCNTLQQNFPSPAPFVQPPSWPTMQSVPPPSIPQSYQFAPVLRPPPMMVPPPKFPPTRTVKPSTALTTSAALYKEPIVPPIALMSHEKVETSEHKIRKKKKKKKKSETPRKERYMLTFLNSPSPPPLPPSPAKAPPPPKDPPPSPLKKCLDDLEIQDNKIDSSLNDVNENKSPLTSPISITDKDTLSDEHEYESAKVSTCDDRLNKLITAVTVDHHVKKVKPQEESHTETINKADLSKEEYFSVSETTREERFKKLMQAVGSAKEVVSVPEKKRNKSHRTGLDREEGELTDSENEKEAKKVQIKKVRFSNMRIEDESPRRPDLDSRLKMMLHDSPQAVKNLSDNLEEKNNDIFMYISPPPSPFLSEEICEKWYRETVKHRRNRKLRSSDFDNPRIKSYRKKNYDGSIFQGSEKVHGDHLEIKLLKSDEGNTSNSALFPTEQQMKKDNEEIEVIESNYLNANSGKVFASDSELLISDSKVIQGPARDTYHSDVTNVHVLPEAEFELVSGYQDNVGLQNIDKKLIDLVMARILEEFTHTIKEEISDKIIEEKINDIKDSG